MQGEKKERSPAKKAAGYVIVSTNIVIPHVDRLKAEGRSSSDSLPHSTFHLQPSAYLLA